MREIKLAGHLMAYLSLSVYDTFTIINAAIIILLVAHSMITTERITTRQSYKLYVILIDHRTLDAGRRDAAKAFP